MAEPVNPYQSPNIPPAESASIAGAWRQGQLLVMNVDSELPPYCVLSGEPADGAREMNFVGRKAGDVFTSSFKIRLPLRQSYLRSYRSARLRSIIGLTLGVLSILSIFGFLKTPRLVNWLQEMLICVLFPLMIAALVGVVLWRSAFTQFSAGPLQFYRAERQYLWLSGAHSKFLARLPEWPGS